MSTRKSIETGLRNVLAIAAALLLISACKEPEETDQQPTVMPESENTSLIEKADEHMRANRAGIALEIYQAAWTKAGDSLDDTQKVWLLLSIANAGVRHGNFEEATDALEAILAGYKESGIVAGNPFFHLLAGLSLNGLKENEEGQTDNFARALICGGPEIFSGENPSHLERMQKLLKPPAELGTWTGYEGSSRDLLNGATGYLRELLTKKIGTPPPYEYEDDEEQAKP